MRDIGIAIALVVACAVLPRPAAAQTLHIALNGEPDVLDPTLSSFQTGHVYAAMCDKLFDLDPSANVVPMLASGYHYDDPTHLVLTLRPDVSFQDGEKLDAEAVAYTFRRNMTMQSSRRAPALSSIQAVEVVDPLTVRFVLKAPSAPFLYRLADNPGIMLAPKAAEAAGADFGLHPVCAGPFAFESRIAHDRIVLRRFAGYWNAPDYHFDEVIYMPMPDSHTRLANLQTGNIDMIGFVPPSDIPTVKNHPRLKLAIGTQMAYTAIVLNLNNGDGGHSPVGQSALLRQAFDAALDRKVLSEVAFNGMFPPTNQPMFQGSPYYIDRLPPPPRDLAKAKALIKQAGVSLPVPLQYMVIHNPWAIQCAEIIQSMEREAGFDVQIKLTEYATSLKAASVGDFQAYQADGGGSIDPDDNFRPFLHTGGSLNSSGYSNPAMDTLLDQARLVPDVAQRREIYAKALDIEQQDLPIIYLFNEPVIMAMRRNLEGFTIVPDGLMRLKDLRLVN